MKLDAGTSIVIGIVTVCEDVVCEGIQQESNQKGDKVEASFQSREDLARSDDLKVIPAIRSTTNQVFNTDACAILDGNSCLHFATSAMSYMSDECFDTSSVETYALPNFLKNKQHILHWYLHHGFS